MGETEKEMDENNKDISEEVHSSKIWPETY